MEHADVHPKSEEREMVNVKEKRRAKLILVCQDAGGVADEIWEL